MFRNVAANAQFPALEQAVLDFWRERGIYAKSLERPSPEGAFVFYEGPPTANGMPHPGHCLTRAIKDVFPRYRTMRGYQCLRKAGWDTHGLPVEVEVCKELGIHSKDEIEEYGIEPFIKKCRESVWRYMQQWERLTERLGFWVDLKQAYVTYHKSYVESVWWSLKTLFDEGLLYQGHKIVWWWAQGGTALSAGEVGQGYRQVADPSVYVRFPIVVDDKAKALGLDESTSLLVWTTTPWTLPSNQFAAVHPELEYVVVSDEHEGVTQKLVVAAALREVLAAKIGRELKVVASLKGSELVGLRYVPPFDYYYKSFGDVVGYLKGSLVGDDDPESDPESQHIAWRIVPASFVTIDSGTGIVHIAPAFGEVDFDVLQEERDRFRILAASGSTMAGAKFVSLKLPELICAVGPDGKFTRDAPEYEGRWVKEADKDIARAIREKGLMWHREEYLHDYPFCWRAEQDPLIQYPRKSWFIRTSKFKDDMLANNAKIHWQPEHIRDGRFGNFLESNVDWALSRERYWGTPLPIWVCQQTGEKEAIASYDELLAKPGIDGVQVWEAAKKAVPDLPEDLRVHKPYIDEVTYDSPFAAGARMRRVSEVIDCWYDSGAMPFAQWGYPHTAGSKERFQSQFPADFISEAIDQTRGWFYSQLAISTLLFGENGAAEQEKEGQGKEYPHPFKNCIVLGFMLGEDGQKMSKSKRNYREPNEIFDKYGADALRWYFYASSPPWTSTRYSEQAIKESIPEFLLRLWNCYSFFVIYAGIDGFDPASQFAVGKDATKPLGDLGPEVLARAKTYRPVAERSELDRWVISELQRTTQTVVERMDAYDNFNACTALTTFVDALSNWYVRRSRDRFWSEDKQDRKKLDAYWTLYECLLTTTKLIAPFTPFMAETIWQNLAVAGAGNGADTVTESVHLCDYPKVDAAAINETLSSQMNLVREVVSLGRSARMGAKLKVRQPLAKVEICLADTTHQAWLEQHAALIREELNVKQVEFSVRADEYVAYTVLPDLKKLGPKLGKRLPLVKPALAKVDAAALLQQLETAGKATLELSDGPLELTTEEVQVRLQAKPGWAASHSGAGVVVVSTEVSPELIAEGLARDFVHSLQTIRKDLDCKYTDRIAIGVVGEEAAAFAAGPFAEYVRSETLATSLTVGELQGAEPVDVPFGAGTLQVFVQVRPS
ncbi:MAG: isoleucine--tRNA ligase [Planctomycetia bacterium]|nr:isoleucine--tRNA ligase [Planctomycetia bacterium]